jgi:hypothetical protein
MERNPETPRFKVGDTVIWRGFAAISATVISIDAAGNYDLTEHLWGKHVYAVPDRELQTKEEYLKEANDGR